MYNVHCTLIVLAACIIIIIMHVLLYEHPCIMYVYHCVLYFDWLTSRTHMLVYFPWMVHLLPLKRISATTTRLPAPHRNLHLYRAALRYESDRFSSMKSPPQSAARSTHDTWISQFVSQHDFTFYYLDKTLDLSSVCHARPVYITICIYLYKRQLEICRKGIIVAQCI